MRKPVKRGSAEYGYILTPPEGVKGLYAAYIYVDRDRARDMLVGDDFTTEDGARAAVLAYRDAHKGQKEKGRE